jgi:hypothetical protein
VNTPLDETDLVAAHLSLMRQNAAMLAAPNEADFDAIVSEKNVTLVYVGPFSSSDPSIFRIFQSLAQNIGPVRMRMRRGYRVFMRAPAPAAIANRYPSLSGHGELVDIGPDVLGRANAVGADTVLKFEYRKS